MKITITLLLAFCFFSFNSQAQSPYSIKGAAADTEQFIKLFNATVTLVNAKDSVLYKFTRAGQDGSFSLSNLMPGKFMLMVTYPEYADYVETFTLDAQHPEHNFGHINMRPKLKILQEVVVKGEVQAIKIKGDTTEFNAKAYVIQPNAKVEDLLKQLPGIQIDKDGKITANGEAVPKVLLDGEEFFGDDPTLVTKNIRADMVSKVQLYDKKSDQAAFTGIDDGVKTKTINIILKEDKKKGVFGKVVGGAGSNDYYEGEALYNKFQAKNKYSAYLTTANDGKTGLGYADNDKIGASSENVQIDGGNVIFFGGYDSDFSSFYNGNGSPLSRTGGLHYDGKFNSDKETINTNFKIGSLDVDGVQTTQSQQTLQTGALNSNTTQNFKNHSDKQKLDFTYSVKLDTTSTLKITLDEASKDIHNQNTSVLSTTDTAGRLVNHKLQSLDNKGTQKNFDITAFYTKKLKKPGRTISWNVSEAYNQTTLNSYESAVTDFYNAATGLKDSTQNLNQYKPSVITSSVLNSNITYSEPLTKKLSLLFNYGLAVNNSKQDRRSYDQSSPGVYNVFDATYSNDYQFNQLTNQVGAIFNYKGAKTIFNFGTKASDINYRQTDEFTGNIRRRSFINWLPQAVYQYRFSQQKSFSFNYNGNTTQPTIDQLQPVLVNTDPLNITIGNPNLKPSFTHRFNTYYRASQILSQQSISFQGYYSLTTDAIINNTVTDATGKSTIQYVNLFKNNPYNYSVYANYNRTIKPIGLNTGLSLSASGSASYSYVNSLLDQANSHTYQASLNLSKYAEKKYQLYGYVGPNYTFSNFSLQPQTNNNAAGFSAYGNATFYLPKKFEVNSNINYTYKAKTQSLDAQQYTLIYASISKTFLKDDNLKISASGNNLLNQNSNINRSVSANAITQTSYSTIKRYFLLTVSWDFTKFGTTPEKK